MSERDTIIRLIFLVGYAVLLYHMVEPRSLYPGDFYFHQAKIRDNYKEIEGLYSKEYFDLYPPIFHKIAFLVLSFLPLDILQFAYSYVYIFAPLLMGIPLLPLFASNTLTYFVYSGTFTQLFISIFFIYMIDRERSLPIRTFSAFVVAISHVAGIFIVLFYWLSRKDRIVFPEAYIFLFALISIFNFRKELIFYLIFGLPLFFIVNYLRSNDPNRFAFLITYFLGITLGGDYSRILLFANLIAISSKRKMGGEEKILLAVWVLLQIAYATLWIPSYQLNYDPLETMPSLNEFVIFGRIPNFWASEIRV